MVFETDEVNKLVTPRVFMIRKLRNTGCLDAVNGQQGAIVLSYLALLHMSGIFDTLIMLVQYFVLVPPYRGNRNRAS